MKDIEIVDTYDKRIFTNDKILRIHSESGTLQMFIHKLHMNYYFQMFLLRLHSFGYYTWKCVKGLKVVDFKHYRQISVFSATNSKLHSNYWYLDVKWKCISIYSEIKYIHW